MKSIKTLSMYLPQYYRTPENDEWWGEGFTDWMAVKDAKPIFRGHHQPKAPLDGNYYNLLEHSVMEWQAELMKKYGVDGQCIYHYYFKEGRMTLQKPAENLLKWKDIDMPFCFCWANERWIRTWQFDPWADKFRKGEIGEQVLMEQKYGGREDWEKHFEYLLPFFRDERYIKVNNSPVFAIMSPNDIYCLEEMMAYWKRRASESGFRDIYFILIGDTSFKGADAILRHAPHAFYNLKMDMDKQGVFTFDYKQLWDRIIDEAPHPYCRTYFAGMPDCDDTPRRGKKGIVLEGFSVQAFYEGMVRLYQKSVSLGNEFVFINAWNEWGEGMYLEPDEEYGYQMLEAVKRAQEDAMAEDLEQIPFDYESGYAKQMISAENRSRKFQKFYKCLNKWMDNLEEGKYLCDYLSEKKIETVAIYGCGALGKHVLKELSGSNITVKYMIDQHYNIGRSSLKVVNPEEHLEEVDAVIVTPIMEYENIENKLKGKIKADILSLEMIVYDI